MNQTDQIFAYLEGELASAELQAFELELASNPELRRQVDDLRNLRSALADLSPTPEPQGKEAVLIAVKAKTASTPALPKFLGWRWVTAGGIGIAILLTYVTGPLNKIGNTGGDIAVATSSPMMERSANQESEAKAEIEPSEGFSGAGAPPAAAADAMTEETAKRTRSMPDPPGGIAGGLSTTRNRIQEVNVNMTIAVLDVDVALQKADNLVGQWGGFSTNRSSSVTEEGGMGNITLRVPQENREKLCADLAALGTVRTKNSTAMDITDTVSAINEQVLQMKATEGRILELIKRARNSQEIRDLNAQLNQVRAERIQIETSLKQMKKQASYNTVEVSFIQRQTWEANNDGNWFQNELDAAGTRFQGLGRFLFAVLLNIAITSPIWIPLVLFGRWFAKRTAR